MTDSLTLVNVFVLMIYSTVLIFAFSNICFRKQPLAYITTFLLIAALHYLVYVLDNMDLWAETYRLSAHLPIFLILVFYHKKRPLFAWIAISSAFLFCTPRTWFATLVSMLFNNSEAVHAWTQILVTIPLLIFIRIYVTPLIRRLDEEDTRTLVYIAMIPTFYYVLEFYREFIGINAYNGMSFYIECMNMGVALSYLVFCTLFLDLYYKKTDIDMRNYALDATVKSAKREIEILRRFDQRTAIYQHDLRHRIIMVNSMIDEPDKLREYIGQISSDLDRITPKHFCKNEIANLMLSAFLWRAEENEVDFDYDVSLAEDLGVMDIDLCTLLGNALENALNAVKEEKDSTKRKIHIKMFERRGWILIEIRNNCSKEVVLHEGLPVSTKENHGYGTKSMQAIVEKYKGNMIFKIDGDVIELKIMLKI